MGYLPCVVKKGVKELCIARGTVYHRYMTTYSRDILLDRLLQRETGQSPVPKATHKVKLLLERVSRWQDSEGGLEGSSFSGARGYKQADLEARLLRMYREAVRSAKAS